MTKLAPRCQTASCWRRSRRNLLIVEEKGKVDLHDSGRLHAHLLPHCADAKSAGSPNAAQRSTMRMSIPKTIANIARNMATSNLIHTSLSQLAIGTRKASSGVLNGSARRWTSTISHDPSSLRQMVATPVAAMRVIAEGVGI